MNGQQLPNNCDIEKWSTKFGASWEQHLSIFSDVTRCSYCRLAATSAEVWAVHSPAVCEVKLARLHNVNLYAQAEA